ncbi:19939_t:CDS:2, partial [Gigaspora margarita]
LVLEVVWFIKHSWHIPPKRLVRPDLALGGLGAFVSKRDGTILSGLEIGARLNSYLHRYGPF